MSERDFSFSPAVRERVPLLIGLAGPSGSGKTFSALRLATGMAKVSPGPILFIDTENRRGLHYAENFQFKHSDFGAPFGSLDYLEALQQADQMKPSVIVVDSMSHEHEGPGGLVDFQSKELDRMAGQDYGKRERMQMLAWQKPKAARRALLQGITRLNANVILCFRAGEKSKPAKNDKGKTEIVEQGFTPIAGQEFVYEMTLCALFRAGARGVPTWESDKPGEHGAIKLPGQFRDLFKDDGQMTEAHGEALAKWALGGAEPVKRAGSIDIDALHIEGEAASAKGMEALQAWFVKLGKTEKRLLKTKLDEDWKPAAEHRDKIHAQVGKEFADAEGMEIPF